MCIAVSFTNELFLPPWYVGFWAYPMLTEDPFYTFEISGHVGPIGFAQGRLFVVNWRKEAIEEFHTSSLPIKPTGHEIEIGHPGFKFMEKADMCIGVGRELGNLKFFLNYHSTDFKYGELLECFSYSSHLLWDMEPDIDPQLIGGKSLERRAMCTDQSHTKC